MKRVTRFQSGDGQLWLSKSQALLHEARVQLDEEIRRASVPRGLCDEIKALTNSRSGGETLQKLSEALVRFSEARDAALRTPDEVVED